MDMIQAMSCDTLEEIDKYNQVTYEGMYNKAVHEYDQIFNCNDWSPSKKGKIYNEEASLHQAYMSKIDRLVEKNPMP